MQKKWVLSLLGLGLSLARLGVNQVSGFEYKMRNEVIKLERYQGETPLRFAVLSDYSGGDRLNSGEVLGKALLGENLDFIVCLGTLFHKKNKNEEVTSLLNTLEILPVIYAPRSVGKIKENEAFYLSELSKSGVVILQNRGRTLALKSTKVSFLGLSGREKGEDSDDYESKILPYLSPSTKDESLRLTLANQLDNFHLYRLLDSDLILVGERGKKYYHSFLGGLRRGYWGLKKKGNNKFLLKGTVLLTLSGFNQRLFSLKRRKPEVLIVEVSKLNKMS